MKKLILALLIAYPVFAQWSDFSTKTASSNLYNAMNGKLNFQIVAGNPNGQLAGVGESNWPRSVFRNVRGRRRG